MQSLIIQGQELELLAEKALLWSKRSALIIADVHLGKITHFRKSGMPIPRQAELENYERLSSLILNRGIKRVLILGDLFHSRLNSEWDRFVRFLKDFQEVGFELVHGNHDILPDSAYQHANLLLHGETHREGPFIFSHHPLENFEAYNIYGHIHPGVIMSGVGRQSLRLPCFHFMSDSAVLPAFGSFTGLHIIKAKASDQVFVISDQSIIAVG